MVVRHIRANVSHPLKTGQIPRIGDIYDEFKAYHYAHPDISRESLAVDLGRHSSWFAAFALLQETDARLLKRFGEIDQLRATVTHPFLLRVYADYSAGMIGADDVARVTDTVIAYILRRAVCDIPTNSLNKTFAGLGRSIDPTRYADSIIARLLSLSSYQRFPSDQEFADALRSRNLYAFKRIQYVLRKLENHGHKEEISTADYSIEHIMPQNENLSPAWREALGEQWTDVQARLLHTLGNLTLTGYNPELSDKAFSEKRDMEKGFRQSHLLLNEGLGELETWNEQTINDRAERLAARAVTIWARPEVPEELIAEYQRSGESGGFDWTLMHAILERIPAGKWTGYFYLAEAIGTHPTPLAAHVSTCPVCVNAHRVLRWDGSISDGFHWLDPEDHRDLREVLEAEGVRFEHGKADPQQKLLAADLLALVGEETDAEVPAV